MKVILVYSPSKAEIITFPTGIAYLVKALHLAGIEVEVIDLLTIQEEKRHSFFEKKLKELDSDCVFGFSIIAGNRQILEVERYAALIKEANEGHTIIYGGPLPSSAPEVILRNCKCDYIICGEGEESIIQILTCKGDLSKVNGLSYFKNGKNSDIIQNKKIRIKNIDYYHPIPFEKFNMDFYIGYLKEVNRAWDISGSRGCRNSCSFCFRFSGPGLTTRSGQSIYDEVEFILKKYGINRFAFTDENFLVAQDNFVEFISLLNKNNIKIKFGGQTRIDQFDKEFCDYLVKNGLERLTFGVEAVDDKILKKINKGFTVSEIEEKIKLVRSYGTDIFANFIVGFPDESRENINKIKEFIKRNQLEKFSKIHYLAPLPNTKLYKEARARGLIDDEWEYIFNMGDLYRDTKINMTSLDREKIFGLYKELFEYAHRKRPMPKKGSKYHSFVKEEIIYDFYTTRDDLTRVSCKQ